MSHTPAPSRLGKFVSEIEETFIAILLGLLTLVTFANVIVRYVFNSPFGHWVDGILGITLPKTMIWALETSTYLFAWLVIFGISYAVKVTAHLGVDAIVSIVPASVRKVMGIVAGLIFIIYAFLLLKGAWDYWANFANLPQTTGRWFPTGFEEMKRTSYRSWYEVNDIYIPEFLRFIEPMINNGESYEKLPRFIPYIILPFGMALLLLRVVQAFWKLVTGKTEMLIVSHEAEDAIDDVRHMNSEA